MPRSSHRDDVRDNAQTIKVRQFAELISPRELRLLQKRGVIPPHTPIIDLAAEEGAESVAETDAKTDTLKQPAAQRAPEDPAMIQKRAKRRTAEQARRRRIQQAGRARAATQRRAPDWDTPPTPPVWRVEIAVPFTYALSKNAIYGVTRFGGKYLKPEARACRDEIVDSVMLAIAAARVHVGRNVLCFSLHVEKPNQSGDAINVIDLVADAIKRAIPLDDRWYAIGRVTWAVTPDHPSLYIAIEQADATDSQVCDACGLILPDEDFPPAAGRRSAIGRGDICAGCLSASRIVASA